MRKLICAILAVVMLQAKSSYGQTFYDLPVNDADGKVIDLRKYIGKKILFLIVPVSGNDSLLLQLDSFLVQYEGRIHVIGVLSEEDGYQTAIKSTVKAIYKKRNILLTEGMRTRKGEGQSPLMQWLTDRRKNNHFDRDTQGPGDKFFVSETGRLYAVMPGRAALTSPMMERIVSSGRSVH